MKTCSHISGVSAMLAAMLWTSSVGAVELPPSKLGLWETTSTMSLHPGPAMRTQICFGEGTEREFWTKGQDALKNYSCKSPGMQRSGDSYVYENACTISAHTMTWRSVMTYQGDASVHSVTTTDSGDGKPPHTMTSDMRWLGACKPGQKPGDSEIMNRDALMRSPGKPGHD